MRNLNENSFPTIDYSFYLQSWYLKRQQKDDKNVSSSHPVPSFVERIVRIGQIVFEKSRAILETKNNKRYENNKFSL